MIESIFDRLNRISELDEIELEYLKFCLKRRLNKADYEEQLEFIKTKLEEK